MDKRQQLLRAVNDEICRVSAEVASEDGAASEHSDFVCECGVEDCREVVRLTVGEFELFRATQDGSLLVAQHHRVVS